MTVVADPTPALDALQHSLDANPNDPRLQRDLAIAAPALLAAVRVLAEQGHTQKHHHRFPDPPIPVNHCVRPQCQGDGWPCPAARALSAVAESTKETP